eukprot:1659153-Prymnesium_polylepis.1
MGHAKARALFHELRQAGMMETPLGLDFTELQQRRYPASPADILLDSSVARALQTLVFPVDSAAAPALWARDQPARGRRRGVSRGKASGAATGGAAGSHATSSADGMLDSLHDTGFAMVSNWSAFGLDFEALAAEVGPAMWRAQLGFKRGTKKVSTSSTLASFEPLAALRSLLDSPELARVVQRYLGGSARYDGHKLMELTNEATEETYASSTWHHDRCGRRLKLFIFMHDVYEGGRPTVVARGSHNTVYYTYGNPWQLLSRYADSWVRSRYAATPMHGPRGGGFVFDTNSLHRGEARGERSRLAVILEFHGHGKVHRLARHNNPCPSSKGLAAQERALQGLRWEHGAPGYGQYPVEMW